MARSATNPRSISSINGSAHHDRNVLETARWSKDLEAAHLRTELTYDWRDAWTVSSPFCYQGVGGGSRMKTTRLVRLAIREWRFRRLYRKYRQYTMIKKHQYCANLHLATTVAAVDGDIVECGTWRGGMIAGIAEVLRELDGSIICAIASKGSLLPRRSTVPKPKLGRLTLSLINTTTIALPQKRKLGLR